MLVLENGIYPPITYSQLFEFHTFTHTPFRQPSRMYGIVGKEKKNESEIDAQMATDENEEENRNTLTKIDDTEFRCCAVRNRYNEIIRT